MDFFSWGYGKWRGRPFDQWGDYRGQILDKRQSRPPLIVPITLPIIVPFDRQNLDHRGRFFLITFWTIGNVLQ